jgi:hypothetical protein
MPPGDEQTREARERARQALAEAAVVARRIERTDEGGAT